MIDLHIMHTDRADADLLARAIDSADVAIDRSPVPVDLHVVLAPVGNQGLHRHAAYRLGSHGWKARLDADDELRPEFFVEVAKHLGGGYDKIQTTCSVTDWTGSTEHGVRNCGGLVVRQGWLSKIEPKRYVYDVLVMDAPAKSIMIDSDLYHRNSTPKSEYQTMFVENYAQASREFREHFS